MTDRIGVWIQIHSARWFARYMGMDNYMQGWTTGDVDFY